MTPEFRAWWRRFATTGDIGPIRLGCTREELRGVLGEPDDRGGTSRKYPEPVIWRYGKLEFHFDDREGGGGLALIFLERDGVVRISITNRLSPEQPPG